MRAPPAACAARPPSRRPISTKPPTARGRRRRRRDERWASRSAGQPFKERSAWTEWSAMDDRSIDRGVPRALPTQAHGQPLPSRPPGSLASCFVCSPLARPGIEEARARIYPRRGAIRMGEDDSAINAALKRRPASPPAATPVRHPPGVKRARPGGECNCSHVTVAGPVAVGSPPCLFLPLEGTDRSEHGGVLDSGMASHRPWRERKAAGKVECPGA